MFCCLRVRNIGSYGVENGRKSLFLSNVHKRFSNLSDISKRNSSKMGSFMPEMEACINDSMKNSININLEKRKKFLELPDIGLK
jgi:hypothetical protein